MRGLKRGEVKDSHSNWEPFLKAEKRVLVCGWYLYEEIPESACDRCGGPINVQTGLAHLYEEKVCLKCAPYLSDN